MANTTIVSTFRSDSMSEALESKLSHFYNSFRQVHYEVLLENKLSPKVTLFNQPHDVIIAVDRSSVIIIASKGTSTDVSSTDRYFDFSSRGSVKVSDLMKSAARDLGWENMTYLKFSRDLVMAPEDLQREEFRRVSQKIVEDIKEKENVADKLGISQALSHLEEARVFFNKKDTAGLYACRTSCKKTILSLISSLTGEKEVGKAICKLHEEGILKRDEKELIDSIWNFIVNQIEIPSNVHSNAPLNFQDDTLLILRLTEATVDYVIKLMARAKG